MTILTDRLVLRPLATDDRPFLLALNDAPGVREHLLPGQATEAFVDRWIEMEGAHRAASTGQSFSFACVPRDGDGEPVGVCALTVVDRVRRVGNVGFEVHPDHTGLGYATEAARALVELAFGPCRLRSVRADGYRDNVASRKVMEKAGLREKRSPFTRIALWWGYPDTRPKMRYAVSRNVWVYRRAEWQARS